MMKKILYASYSVIPSDTANSVAVMRQCAALSRQSELKAILLKPRGARADYREFYDVPELDMTLLPEWSRKCGEWPLKLAVCAGALHFRPDLVYSRDLLLNESLCRLGMKNIYEMHQLDQQNPVFDRYYKSVLERIGDDPRLHRIVCISESLKSECLGFGIPEEKLVVLHSGVELGTECGEPRACPEIPTVMYVGSLQPGKGVELLIEMAALTDHFRFVIVGGRAGTLGRLSANAEHIPQVEPSKVRGYMDKADILILPFTEQRYKFFSPLKLFEYMAAGKVIIASDVDGVREVVKHRESGMLATAGNAQSFLDVLSELRGNPALYRALQINARRTAERYSWDNRASKILELI